MQTIAWINNIKANMNGFIRVDCMVSFKFLDRVLVEFYELMSDRCECQFIMCKNGSKEIDGFKKDELIND